MYNHYANYGFALPNIVKTEDVPGGTSSVRHTGEMHYAVITVPAFPLTASATKSREVISTLPVGTASR